MTLSSGADEGHVDTWRGSTEFVPEPVSRVRLDESMCSLSIAELDVAGGRSRRRRSNMIV
jgi:hypothetical protein